MQTQTPPKLRDNSRFYILVSTLLLSVGVFALLRLRIPSDQLFYIRVQQVYGFLCVLYWYVALVISPLGYVIGKQRLRHAAFARRAIGVSAFYFATLHGAIALWGQLGGIGQLRYLPTLFQWSLLGGLIACGILFVMAATSFDVVVKVMTFRWWKWLHRLVYIGGVVAVLHIWTVGTHLAYSSVQVAAFAALIVLSGLELYRVTKLVNQKYLHLGRAEAATLFMALWIMAVTIIGSIPVVVRNYHSRHADHSTQQEDSPSHGHNKGRAR